MAWDVAVAVAMAMAVAVVVAIEKTKALYSGLNKSYLKEAIKELN